MIRKSAWLLSAGLVAVATPAFGQTAVSNTDTDKQAAQPTPGAAEGAATQDQARQQQPVDTSKADLRIMRLSPPRAKDARCGSEARPERGSKGSATTAVHPQRRTAEAIWQHECK